MEGNVQKYELTQNGRTFILSTEINDQFVKLTCVESGTDNLNLFLGEFSLNQLRQLSSRFNNISNVIEAQETINQIIENQKVSIEPQGSVINIVLFFSNESETNDSYIMKMGLNSQGVMYNKPLIFNSVTQGPTSPTKRLPEKIISSKAETVIANSIYSPLKRLPDIHMNLPPEQTITAQPIFNGTENNQNNNYNYGTQYDTNIYKVDTNTNVDSLTFSFNPSNQPYQTQNENYDEYFNQYQANTTETQYQEYVPTEIPNIGVSSPQREQIEYAIPGSPSSAKITYSSAPSHHHQQIVETTTTTTTHPSIDMSLYDQKINNLQNETNAIRAEYNLMKSEANKLNGEVGQLKGQVHILLEENRILRQQSGAMPNESQIHEIKFLKQENERLRKQSEENMNIKNTFEQYKIVKEEEIKYLKLQIEALLKNQKKSEEIISLKQREIDELKKQNGLLKSNESISQSNLIEKQNNTTETLKNQSLTFQDTQLKTVKGDIIESTEELELLTRKICKNHKKVTLNLLYKATVDSDKAAAFHKKCDWADNTLVLIKIGNGRRFGGYTTCSWKGDCNEKEDDEAFVFSLDKMQTYDILPEEDAIGCYPRYGPVFLGCQIRIYDDFFTRGGTTFEKGVNYDTHEDYELSGGLKKYDVKEIEV